jgi:hypothetical protein
MKKILLGVIVLSSLVAIVVVVRSIVPNTEVVIAETAAPDVLDASFVIDGKKFALVDGKAEVASGPGSAVKETVSIFGEPVYADLDSDGDDDVAVLLVHNGGGSGTFYYAALVMRDGTVYKATNAMYLGDRIAPQTVEVRDGRAVFNYAERRSDEPMTALPSIGKSVWVHYDKESHTIGEWVSDFEGESDFTERFSARVDRVDVVFEQKDFKSYRLITNGAVREGELNTERGFEDDQDATVYVLNWQKPEAQQMLYVRFTNEPTKLYLLDSDRKVITGSVLTKQ